MFESLTKGTIECDRIATSNRTSLPEVVAGCGLTFDPDQLQSMTDTLAVGLLDRCWRSRSIALGLEHADRFRWESFAEGILQLLARSCGQSLSNSSTPAVPSSDQRPTGWNCLPKSHFALEQQDAEGLLLTEAAQR